MNTVMTITLWSLCVLSSISQAAYAVPYQLAGEDYTVVQFQNHQVVIPLFLDLELKAKGAPHKSAANQVIAFARATQKCRATEEDLLAYVQRQSAQ